MSYSLSNRSIDRLSGVHPDLVKVVQRAIEITTIDFVVLEGVRTTERQKILFDAGASQTLNSRHIKGPDGFAKAVDLGAWIDDEVRWDWPSYHHIAKAMKTAAAELKIQIVWGGDWVRFKDGPHFELDRRKYP
jgi:peptidoglycan L-alanyl-D-glutamate endopeptidase CwlK